MTKGERKRINNLGLYNCVFDENFQSPDHKSVFNILDVIVFRDDEEKMRKIEREVLIIN